MERANVRRTVTKHSYGNGVLTAGLECESRAGRNGNPCPDNCRSRKQPHRHIAKVHGAAKTAGAAFGLAHDLRHHCPRRHPKSECNPVSAISSANDIRGPQNGCQSYGQCFMAAAKVSGSVDEALREECVDALLEFADLYHPCVLFQAAAL
ncbi:MAG: hypothetical protein JW395_1555 [Nitrospira sp.]|nr:hypothetical protein [Nitrospira sp.]